MAFVQHTANTRLIIKTAIQRSRSSHGPWMGAQRFKSAVATHRSSLDQEETTASSATGQLGSTNMPDFTNARAAYASKTTTQLLRASLVYNMCNITPLVKHADPLLRLSRRVFGNFITDFTLKTTIFGHFCSGENEDELMGPLKELQKHGIGGILDYAAESDTIPEETTDNSSFAQQLGVYHQAKSLYDYESEAVCDEHVDVFRSCIRSVHKVAPDGFAAVKVTALGNPKLLERMSKAIVEAENLFSKLDDNNDGVVTCEEFDQGYRYFFNDDDGKLENLIKHLDPEDSGYVDYITWSKMLSPSDLPSLTSSCREFGPLALATPTDEEIELIEKMFQRAHAIAEEAVQCGTRILVDAEQARFQPAIDNLVLELQQKYNSIDTTDVPIIFNTYQCYRKGALDDIISDVERSERYGYHFGAKMVRGAYLESERTLADVLHYVSPIHDSIDETHQCYDDSVEFLLRHSVKTDKKLEVMCGTHNQLSIEKAIHLMNELGIDRRDGTVHFGQLLGMADNLTFNLGEEGYSAYKYVPYGKVSEVMPYLIRRAQENSAVLGNANRELALLYEELGRRLKPSFM